MSFKMIIPGGLMDGGSPIPRAAIERAAEIFSSPNHKLKISVHNVDPTNAFNMSSASMRQMILL